MEKNLTIGQQLALQMTEKRTRGIFLLIIAVFLIAGIVVIINSLSTITHLSQTEGQWEIVKAEVSNVTLDARRSSGESKSKTEYEFQANYSYGGQEYHKQMESASPRSEGQIIDVYVNSANPEEVRQDISGTASVFIIIAGCISAAFSIFLFVLYLKAVAYRKAYARQS